VEVPMMNERHSKTFYGALDLQSQDFHLQQYEWANMENTVKFLKWLLEEKYSHAKQIFIIWDGASFHTGKLVQEFLHSVNQGLKKRKWKLNCILFAPNAPDQNPVEDCWLKAKNFVRENILQNDSFSKTVQCFKNGFNELSFDFGKLQWYY
jgi:transposase